MKPNIVVVVVDTLRPDHLGCYGYSRPTSPWIDALAAESLVFERAFAAGIPTTPSFTTLLTGLHPYRHGVVTHPGSRHLSEDILLLPQIAKSGGYVTAACDNLVVQGSGRGTWFARGYDHYSGFLYTPFGDQSTQLTDRALEIVRRQRDRPLFLFMHYWDPHTPYGPMPPYDTMHWEPGSGPVDLADVRAIHPDYYDAFIADMDLRHPDDYAYVVAQYDGEISQVDAQIGRLVEGMQELGSWWDDTAFLLVSDHGECFGEGGLYFDHHGLYDAVTRIAMLLRLPSGGHGRVGRLVSQEDVLPTLCRLGGLDLPPYPLTGHDLLERSAPRERTYVVSTECTRQASIALRTESEKLILPIVEDADGRAVPDFYGRPRSPDPLLFDVGSDPAESVNLAESKPERVQELRGFLEGWRADMLGPDGPDPLLTQPLTLPYAQFMRRVLDRHSRRR
ncbi:MAG TPA: sulfatase [Actinopolymorphaceae bacterium]